MAEPRPLQAGDRAPDYSGVDSSTAADRRPETENPPHPEMGTHAAPSYTGPQGLIWKAGQQAPDCTYETLRSGPENGRDGEDVVHEINMSADYGDAFDPEAPMRVMIDTRWNFDPDNDGKV